MTIPPSMWHAAYDMGNANGHFTAWGSVANEYPGRLQDPSLPSQQSRHASPWLHPLMAPTTPGVPVSLHRHAHTIISLGAKRHVRRRHLPPILVGTIAPHDQSRRGCPRRCWWCGFHPGSAHLARPPLGVRLLPSSSSRMAPSEVGTRELVKIRLLPCFTRAISSVSRRPGSLTRWRAAGPARELPPETTNAIAAPIAWLRGCVPSCFDGGTLNLRATRHRPVTDMHGCVTHASLGGKRLPDATHPVTAAIISWNHPPLAAVAAEFIPAHLTLQRFGRLQSHLVPPNSSPQPPSCSLPVFLRLIC